jgi:hypothetical protein
MWVGTKNRSHSQMSVQHANNKNKLVDFTVVSGWSALAGRWCSAWLVCFSTELQVYLNGQWCELFKLQVMMCHGLIVPHLHQNKQCVRKYTPKVNYSATVCFVWLVISLSIYLFFTFLLTSKRYLLEDWKCLHEGSMALLGLIQISLLGDPIEVRQEEFWISKLASDIHRMT